MSRRPFLFPHSDQTGLRLNLLMLKKNQATAVVRNGIGLRNDKLPEGKADEDVKEGRHTSFDNPKDAIKYLKSAERPGYVVPLY